MVLEVAAFSPESVILAHSAGAQRVEFCAEYALGGITPTAGSLQMVPASLRAQTWVMIRPRSGHFCFTPSEHAAMQHDLDLVGSLGYGGVVVGALKPDNTIDESAVGQWVSRAWPMEVTFHRAFDQTPDLIASLQVLEQLGVQRILTSGGAPTAAEGIHQLEQLCAATENLSILAGGGIRRQHIAMLQAAGIAEVHSAALAAPDPNVTRQFLPDTEEIKAMLLAMNSHQISRHL